MKNCYILFGPPCSGKTYYIHTNKLENKTISFDVIRQKYPELKYGALYEQFYKEVDDRLSNSSEDIYIDMVLYRLYQLGILKDICTKNNYNIALIDIEKDIDLDILKQRNSKRKYVNKLTDKDLEDNFKFYTELKKEKRIYEIISR